MAKIDKEISRWKRVKGPGHFLGSVRLQVTNNFFLFALLSDFVIFKLYKFKRIYICFFHFPIKSTLLPQLATPVTSDRLEGTEGILTRPLTPAWEDQVDQVDVVLLGLADLTLGHIR